MTKQELREDRVAAAAAQAAEYVQRNARWLGAALAVVVVGIVVAVLVAQGRARAERESSLAMFQAQNLYFGGDYVGASTQFQALADRYGSTDQGRLARLFEGNAHLALGNAEAAETAFRKFLEDSPKNDLNEAAARRGLAGSMAQQGRFADAASEYTSAARLEGNPLAAQDWLQAGRSSLEAGNRQEAVTAFREVLRVAPENPAAAEARVLLAETQARQR